MRSPRMEGYLMQAALMIRAAAAAVEPPLLFFCGVGYV